MNAAAYLAKFGWKEGKGLGKDGTGIKTYIHAAKKDDMRGVGSKGKEVGLAPEWNDVFKRAAANVTIEADDEGIKLKSAETDAPRALVYDRFRRGTTLDMNDKKDTEIPSPSARASPTSDSSTSSSSSSSNDTDESSKDKKKKKKSKRRAEEAAAAAEEEAKKVAAAAATSDDATDEKPKKRKRAKTSNNNDDSTSSTTVVPIAAPVAAVATTAAKDDKPKKVARGRPGRPLPDSDSDSDDERLHLYHGRCQGKLARLRTAEAAASSL